MLRSLFFFIYLLVAVSAYAQATKKYPLGKSGCFAYFQCNPGEFTTERSPDSSQVYTGECMSDSVSYGVICVRVKDKYSDMTVSEDMLVSYLDYLKTSLKVTTPAAYVKGSRLKNNEHTRGVAGTWQDGDGDNWKLQGWTDGRFIAVMYVSTKQKAPEAKANAFFNSLLLPGKTKH